MANQNLPALLNSDVIKNRFNEVLGKNATTFVSTLANICTNNPQLQNCDGRSVIGAAMLSTTLNLSITPSLGQAYIVPFKTWDKETRKEIYKAQLQIGVRGYIQLAHRTGQYTRLHAGKMCEGEFRGFNPLTGEIILGEKISDDIVGYVAHMKLVNGFEKTIFMSKAEMEAHAEKYSQSYSYDKRTGKSSSPWSTNFDGMAAKTVLKKLLRTWGTLNTNLMTAIEGDQSVVDKDTFTYVDNGGNVQKRDEILLPEEQPAVDAETGEVEGLKFETEEKKDGVPF